MICIHCGELGNGSEDFLCCMPQLIEKNMTDVYNFFPICFDCIAKEKKVAKGNKRIAVQARNERITIASGNGNYCVIGK